MQKNIKRILGTIVLIIGVLSVDAQSNSADSNDRKYKVELLSKREVRSIYTFIINDCMMSDREIVCNVDSQSIRRDSICIFVGYRELDSRIPLRYLNDIDPSRSRVPILPHFDSSYFENLATLFPIGLKKLNSVNGKIDEGQFPNDRMLFRFEKFHNYEGKRYYVVVRCYSRARKEHGKYKFVGRTMFYFFKRNKNGIISFVKRE